MSTDTLPVDAFARLTRPIVGLENRTAREVFDIMVDRINCDLPALAPHLAGGGEVVPAACKPMPRDPDAAMREAAFGPIMHGGRDGPITIDFLRQEAAISVYQMMWDAAATPPATPAQDAGAAHPDDLAVDRFAAAMKAKLAQKRAEGRGGWEDKDDCSAEFLSFLLREYVEKGDPIDVGNLAMMLHQRGERI